MHLVHVPQAAPTERARRVGVADRDAESLAQTASRLRFLGFNVQVVASGAELLALIESGWPDVVVLDVVLPDVNGLVLCGQIRARFDVPMIFYSGSRRKDDQTLGRMLGADDFIPKSVDAHEFQARIGAVLRRVGGQPAELGPEPPRAPPVVYGSLVVDRARQRVTLGGTVLSLTPIEYRLLVALAEHPGAIVTRAQLAELLWGSLGRERSRGIDAHMVNLRVKLRAGPVPPPRIVAVRGTGYRLLPAYDDLT